RPGSDRQGGQGRRVQRLRGPSRGQKDHDQDQWHGHGRRRIRKGATDRHHRVSIARGRPDGNHFSQYPVQGIGEGALDEIAKRKRLVYVSRSLVASRHVNRPSTHLIRLIAWMPSPLPTHWRVAEGPLADLLPGR